MNPLHDYIAGLLAKHLRDRRIVVWYDERKEFLPFVLELGGEPGSEEDVPRVRIGDVEARLVAFEGSFLEVRGVVERYFAETDKPDYVVVYVPGVKHDLKGSLLKELECAGMTWEPALRSHAREVLSKRFALADVDEALTRPNATYDDLSTLAAGPTGEPQPSLLRGLLKDTKRPGNKNGSDEMLAVWLTDPSRDAGIADKGAVNELVRTVATRLGLTLPNDAELPKLRALTLRYLLGNEFRQDLINVPPPSALDGVPLATHGYRAAVVEVDDRLRRDFPDAYEAIARRVQDELRLDEVTLTGGALGKIDTFPFEERSLYVYAAGLVASGEYAQAMTTVDQRKTSFWVGRSQEIADAWRLLKSMAELGQASLDVKTEVVAMNGKPARAWVEAYTRPDGMGWARLDELQRRMEHEAIRFDHGIDEKALGSVRRLHEDVVDVMSAGFAKALAVGGWHMDGALAQTSIWGEVLEARSKPAAYFMVDALRFEMGAELARRMSTLPGFEVTLRPAIAVLPGITPLGMAALLPGAAGGFSAVTTKSGKLASRIRELTGDTLMPDLAARKKYVAARMPTSVDISLDDLLGLAATKLKTKVDGATVVIVRSQEIDRDGEGGLSVNARSTMENVLENLVRAVRKLATAGVESAVLTADHGHLFFHNERDTSIRVDSPGGDTVELHRRCWIGRGGATPAGCVRVSAASLGYESDLEFVFPPKSAVFKAGGDLNYHHGGLSLQEVVVPVITTRSTHGKTKGRATGNAVQLTSVPDKITNRIVSIAVTSLLGASFTALLLHKEVVVGRCLGMTGDGQLDNESGRVVLSPGGIATLALLLSDDGVKEVTLSLRDPVTDAELCPAVKLPVKLGV